MPTEFIPDLITINTNSNNQAQAIGINASAGNQGIFNPIPNITPTVEVGTSGSVGSNLLASTTYYYGVSAVSPSGKETAILSSNQASATEGATAYPITISWNLTSQAVAYRIYKGTSTTIYLLGEVGASVNSYIDNGNTATTTATPSTTNDTGEIIANGSIISNFNAFFNAPSGFVPITINSLSGTNSINYLLGGTQYWTQGLSSSGDMEFNSPSGNSFYFFNNGSQILKIGNDGSISSSPTQTTITGITAGNIVCSMPFQGPTYKKVVIFANGYENDSTTEQTYTFPVPFTNPNATMTFNNTGMTPLLSQTEIGFVPDTTTAYTGLIILEGY